MAIYSKHAYIYIFPTVHPVSKSRISFSAQQVQKAMVGCFWLYVPIIPYGTRWKCTISAENPHKSAGSVHLYFQPRQSLKLLYTNSFCFLIFKENETAHLVFKTFLTLFLFLQIQHGTWFFKVEFHKIYLVRPPSDFWHFHFYNTILFLMSTLWCTIKVECLFFSNRIYPKCKGIIILWGESKDALYFVCMIDPSGFLRFHSFTEFTSWYAFLLAAGLTEYSTEKFL